MPPLLLLLLLLFCSHLASTNGDVTLDKGEVPNCPSFDCGNGVNIPYPFWVRQNTSADPKNYSYCGYQDLEVTCNGEIPTFETFSDNYTITKIDNGTNTISLTDSDVMNSTCPRVKHEVNISKIPTLEYAPGVVNLTFFFNCSMISSPLPQTNLAGCLKTVAGPSYVFFDTVQQQTYDLLSKACQGGVVVSPILETIITPATAAIQFPTALQGGFELKWKKDPAADMSECKSCESSGGYCGFWNRTGSGMVFTCFCPDGSKHPRNCKDAGFPTGKGSKLTKGKKILIGVIAFLVFIIASCGSWFLYIHRKNNKRTSSALRSLVYSTSSNPSLAKDPESVSGHYQTPIFSYEELQEATNGFDSSTELGDGGFGTVYKGKLKDGRIVAVKRLYENNYRRVEQFLNEVVILNRLRHQNLVTLYGCTSRHSRELLLVYEYVPNGTVADHLHGSRADERALTWPLRMNIAIETAEALAYLHAVEPQIIHRDVKTNNILLDNSFHVKVADFGLSRLFPLDATHVSTAPQGTPGYLDPEYHQCYQLTDKSDVYSFGVVLVELISSKTAVDITRHRHEINLSHMAINKISKGLVHELVDPALGFESDLEARRTIELVAELAFRCLQADREMRPSMGEVCQLLKSIANGDCKDEKNSDSDKHMGDDKCLLDPPMPYSPNTVTMKWKSSSTTPNTSA